MAHMFIRAALALSLIFTSFVGAPAVAAPTSLALVQQPRLVISDESFYIYVNLANKLQWAGNVVPRIDTEWFRCEVAQTAEINGTPRSCTSFGKRENDRVVSYMIAKEDQGFYIALRFTAILGSESLSYFLSMNNPVPDYFKPPVHENFPTITIKQPTISNSSFDPNVATAGSTLVLNPPTWKTKTNVRTTYSWFICDFVGKEMTTEPPGCTKLDGYSSQNEFVIANRAITADKKSIFVGGKSFRVAVTASISLTNKRSSPGATVYSASTNAIALKLPVLINSDPPVLSYKIPAKSSDPVLKLDGARVGHELTAQAGSWTSDSPIKRFVTYLRCDYPIASVISTLPSACTTISKEFDADKANPVTLITEAERGKYVTAQVRIENLAGSVYLYLPSLLVRSETFTRLEMVKAPTATIGTELGNSISIDPGTWKGTPPSYSYTWYACPTKVAAKIGYPGGTVNGVFAQELKGCGSFSQSASTTIPESAIGKYVVAIVNASNAISSLAVIIASSDSPITGTKPKITNLPQISSEIVSGKTNLKIPVQPIWFSDVRITSLESNLVLCGSQYEAGLTTLPSNCVTKSGNLTKEDEGYYVAMLFSATNSSGKSYVMTNTAGLVNNVSPNLGDKFIFQVFSENSKYVVGSTMRVRLVQVNSTPAPQKFSYQWYQCSQTPPTNSEKVPESCIAIPGKKSSSYVVTNLDRGKFIGAIVTAENLVFSQSKFFGRTTRIAW